MLLLEYPRCSTCQKAKRYLEDKNFNFEVRNIVIDKLNINELDRLIKKSEKDINKFFNTSGLKYRELKLKDKIQTMSYEEKIQILSTDGMLVKRPLLELDDTVLIGFRENEWNNVLGI
ncbi:MAG: Spx/MgsR family RNA polymerase-binding regulatory protein [Tenericutes bacterium]|mgnify:FL=1|nr:Spx/MgsR family RNA polymerase-binding regulatory protein [Mycoplasmatota bacterium]